MKIFNAHKNDRICILATTCCGKSTLLKSLSNCVDMDDELWPKLNKKEIKYVSQNPWTQEIGKFMDSLARKKLVIQPGQPMFSTVIIDCDVLVYLDIDDKLLKEHCKKRNVKFSCAKKFKNSINNDWNKYYKKYKNNKKFYYLLMSD